MHNKVFKIKQKAERRGRGREKGEELQLRKNTGKRVLLDSRNGGKNLGEPWSGKKQNPWLVSTDL